MTVTRNTPWRAPLDVPYEFWRDTITSARNPNGTGERADPELASIAAWNMAQPLSALCLAMMKAESSYGTHFEANPRSNKNPLNLKLPQGGGYVSNLTWIGGIQSWRQRITSPTYKNGIYADTETIAELIHVFAPTSENATEQYIAGVVQRMNAYPVVVETPSTPEEPIPEEGEPMAYNYDNGTPPPWVDYPVAESKKYAGYIDPDDHFIAACVVHSAYGGIVGTTQWYQGGNALTDTMVGNSFDGAALDGQIRRFNDAYGNRYAHSSGPVDRPIDDAAKFLEIFGPSPSVINMYTSAMERSCAANVATNPVTEKEHAARVHWIAYHANRYGKRVKQRTGKDGFTCDTFPLIPGENNRSFIIWHGEVNAGKRQVCPDAHVRATIDRMIADVRALLGSWQKSGVPIPPQVPPEQMPTYAPVKPIASLQAYKDKDTAPAIVIDGGKTYVFVNDRVKAIRDTKRRQTAELDAEEIGPVITKDTEFAVLWLFQDADGTPWYISPWWTRIPVTDTERVADAA